MNGTDPRPGLLSLDSLEWPVMEGKKAREERKISQGDNEKRTCRCEYGQESDGIIRPTYVTRLMVPIFRTNYIYCNYEVIHLGGCTINKDVVYSQMQAETSSY